MKKNHSILKKIIIVVVITFISIFAIFMAGRYGWKLAGFSACESAGIVNVEVTEKEVHIKGFNPSSFPTGFLGYHAEEDDGVLYVGFKFSALFGMFETGDFDITIPVENEISKVVIKTNSEEHQIWPKNDHEIEISKVIESGSYESGVYIKLERDDVYSIGWYYENESGGMTNANNTPLRAETYLYLDFDLVQIATELGRKVPFRLTFSYSMSKTIAQVNLEFDLENPLMVVTLDKDGKLLVNGQEVDKGAVKEN